MLKIRQTQLQVFSDNQKISEEFRFRQYVAAESAQKGQLLSNEQVNKFTQEGLAFALKHRIDTSNEIKQLLSLMLDYGINIYKDTATMRWTRRILENASLPSVAKMNIIMEAHQYNLDNDQYRLV